MVHTSLKSFDLLYALDQRNLSIDTPSLYMWFTTFDGGFYDRGATIATPAADRGGAGDRPVHLVLRAHGSRAR